MSFAFVSRQKQRCSESSIWPGLGKERDPLYYNIQYHPGHDCRPTEKDTLHSQFQNMRLED